MSVKCFLCGIASKRDNRLWCEKYQVVVTEDDPNNKNDCHYFMEVVIEDGEPLSARQHLMLKENELASRKMRGTV
ncbi:Hypothetical protein LUCI_1678 [Lucifera butyrica]|uniref:Uncharacterized protein n=1 Tax=Lucifera butyrica TaxID=1351585 RepID=A0A498R1H8_9FIRM|nr:hypothetical protein [Lucifera butyrica]VBB06446.1 Hypothetical protein LUCI_1678 [Lucifera butyrica]